MRAIIQQRARIARVRHVQHMQAAAAAQSAEGQLLQLENSAERLTMLRGSLTLLPGESTGAALAGSAELAMRLDNARTGLVDAIASARALAAERAAQRLDARRRKESAEKLNGRAAAALVRLAEQRASAGRPRRTSRIPGDDE